MTGFCCRLVSWSFSLTSQRVGEVVLELQEAVTQEGSADCLAVMLQLLSFHISCVCAGEEALKLQGDYTWEESAAPSLTGLNASIKTGELLVIVGQTGKCWVLWQCMVCIPVCV